MRSRRKRKWRSRNLIARVEHFFRKLRRRVSRSEWAIRRWRLSTSEETSLEPGILLLQIDGLSRRQMERAMERGRLPFLRSLRRRQRYDLKTFYSGLPSSTPAVQGELYYGKRCAVPAFSFVDRKTKRVTTMYNPDSVKEIEAGLAEHDEGLLQGGSSWSNIYTGGAGDEESHFCAARLGLGDLLKAGTFFSVVSFILLQLPALLRLATLLVVEFFVALWDMVRGVFFGENFGKELRFILARVFVCVGLRELVTVGAKIDLARGLPVVHVNFLGYDEQAHRRGPSSAFAHWSLKGIDRAVQRLYHAARQSHRRDYQVWIFSDHGQELTRSFAEEHGAGIEAVIREALAPVREYAHRPPRPQQMVPHAYLAGGRRVKQRLQARSLTEPLTEHEEESFTVAAMGPLGHVYFAEALTLEEKRELAHRLVGSHQIPGVLFPVGHGHAEWIHAGGTVHLPEEGEFFLPHPEGIRREVAKDLVILSENPLSGDIILLGWRPHHQSWSFPIERGAHAGPGLQETQGFLLLPPKTRLPEERKAWVRPSELRLAALHLLRRQRLPGDRKSRARRHPHRLRVMTYNIHSCVGMDGKCSPSRVARLIEWYEPDIVALQEIDLGHVRSQGLDQAAVIASELEMYSYFCPTVIHGTEHYGHALLSRFPLEILRTDTLASGRPFGRREPRGALWARVRAGDLPIHVINTHFGLSRFERMAQATDLLGDGWIGGIGAEEPVILCGDFNALPDSVPHRSLSTRLRDIQQDVGSTRPLKTFTAFHPFCRIDHIFVSGHFRTEKAFVPRNHLSRVASDHLPLVADLVVVESLVGDAVVQEAAETR